VDVPTVDLDLDLVHEIETAKTFHFYFHFIPPNYLLIKLTDIAQTRRRRGRDAGSRTSSGTVGSSVAWHLHR
jgi:hypothetical protein